MSGETTKDLNTFSCLSRMSDGDGETIDRNIHLNGRSRFVALQTLVEKFIELFAFGILPFTRHVTNVHWTAAVFNGTDATGTIAASTSLDCHLHIAKCGVDVSP